MSQLCGLWSIYTIFQHFNRCIFPASLFFNCKNQKNTFRFLGFFLPCFSLFNLSHPREAFSMGRKRQTFRFRHETRIWEIQWNPFGIFLGRNSKRKFLLKPMSWVKRPDRIERALGSPLFPVPWSFSFRWSKCLRITLSQARTPNPGGIFVCWSWATSSSAFVTDQRTSVATKLQKRNNGQTGHLHLVVIFEQPKPPCSVYRVYCLGPFLLSRPFSSSHSQTV